MRWGWFLVVVCVCPVAARAASMTFSSQPGQTLELHSGTSATWRVWNMGGTVGGSVTGSCGTIPGLSVADGSASNGGPTKTDAFDNAFTVWVDDVQFVSPDAVDVTDETLTSGPVSMSGLDVTVEYKAIDVSSTLRTLVTLRNPTAAEIVATFKLGTNFGSDGLTTVLATGTSSNWFATSDNATTPDDAPVTIAAQGATPGFVFGGTFYNGVSSSTTWDCSGHQGVELKTDELRIPAGRTVVFMQFARLATTNAAAIANGADFDAHRPADALLAGISEDVRSQIVNWNLPGEFILESGGLQWGVTFNNGTGDGTPLDDKCEFSTAPGVQDARLSGSTAHDDAFDGGLLLFIDGTQLPEPVAMTQTGQTVNIQKDGFQGLDVAMAYTAIEGEPTLRTLIQLTNPSDTSRTSTVQLATNVGSDENTVVTASSSGDTTIGSDDRWIVTADNPTTPNDAVNTHVVQGPTPPLAPTSIGNQVFQCSENTAPNGVLATYTLTFGPRESRALLFFNQLHETLAGAAGDAPSFNTTPLPVEPRISDLQGVTLSRVANWRFCRDATYESVNCQLAGLKVDTDGAGMNPAVLKLSGLIAKATTAVDNAGTAASTGKRKAVRAQLKRASGALKSFAKLLKSKKSKAAIVAEHIARLTTHATAIRESLKGLPTAL